jgi:hypothetical protein
MSNFFSINTADLARGLVVAALTASASLTAIVQALSGHGLDVVSYDWPFIAKAALSAAGGYLNRPGFVGGSNS